ncbi:MAG: copper-translocating P-type ATPase [Chlorobiaceae bacterium]|nr:copper-translocating P-type ATPase [Chlorobiaceae bacterium]
MDEVTYRVKGMHCASCAAIIRKKLLAVTGIGNVEVNQATEQAKISFSDRPLSDKELNDIVTKYGYELVRENNGTDTAAAKAETINVVSVDGLFADKEEQLERQRKLVMRSMPAAIVVFLLMMWDIASTVFRTLPLMPLSMEIFNGITMILASIFIFRIGTQFLDGIGRFFRYGTANMDTLIGIGTFSAFTYSSLVTIFPSLREQLALPSHTYFDVTIVVIGFVHLGKYLEVRSRLKTGEAIGRLAGLQAKSALLIRKGEEIEIPADKVKKGNLLLVKPGAKIPVDGIITKGNSSIDESMVTGEPFPVDRKEGDSVMAGTINKQGSFTFTAMKVGKETMLARIIAMVEEAQGSKAPIQNIADRIAAVFVPAVLAIAAVTLIVWLTVGSSILGFQTAISYAIMGFVGILIIACPCALGLATPTAIITGIGKGAENGILIRNAESLERLSRVNTIVLDKTGTITKGAPTLSDTIPLDNGITAEALLQYAAGVERYSEHPLAEAIVRAAKTTGLELPKMTGFVATEGFGVKARKGDILVTVRKPDMQEVLRPTLNAMLNQGKTIVIVEIDKKAAGMIVLSDTLKEGVKESIAALKNKGMRIIMMTGDNPASASHIASLAGIDEVIAGVLPIEKAAKIHALQNEGKIVAMAGDGINDAPALAQADVGIAMATGTDIAMESAGITLLKGDIRKIPQAVALSRTTMRIIRQNLFWAFIYNIIGIPLATGALYPVFGIVLNPVFSGIAMAGSSVSVVSNSLRLKTIKLR